MILHHFTNPVNVPGIVASGLIPASDQMMTLGKPVVWLTLAGTMEATDADRAWLEVRRRMFSVSQIEQRRKYIFGSADDARLTVRLPSSSRLKHYATWLRKHPTVFLDAANGLGWADNNSDLKGTATILAHLSGTSRETDWYVYFGAIPSARITFPLAANDNKAFISSSTSKAA